MVSLNLASVQARLILPTLKSGSTIKMPFLSSHSSILCSISLEDVWLSGDKMEDLNEEEFGDLSKMKDFGLDVGRNESC